MTKPLRSSSDNLRQVDRRLKEWGHWYVKSACGGMGYPSQATLVTALQGSRSTAPHYPKDNKYAEEINTIINDLKMRHPEWGSIIHIEYTEAGARSSKADILGIPKVTYTIKLDRARAWVDARLK